MKFETINGQLCRMVEPEPLTLEATFPCVVRLIQDNSPMGRLNRRYRDTNIKQGIKYICVSAKNSVMQTETDSIMAIEAYEIIGYPVVEGSKEWALYQIRSGKKVVRDGDVELYSCSFYKNRLFYLNGSGCLVTKNAIGLIDPCSEEEFLCLDETGWQLYEPEPEPKESPIDPIEKPLRNLILEAKENGVNIRTRYQNMIFTPDALTGLLAEGKFRWWNICNWDLTDKEQNYYPPIKLVKPEPEHEPAFKVGDWVETNDGIHGVIVEPINNTIVNIETTNYYAYQVGRNIENITRKLSPSEVRVKVTLEGTVHNLDNKFFALHPAQEKGQLNPVAIIPFAMLDAQTRELVESLLKAHEEK